ncbi:hypothetical protein F4780DRAFT_796459 [Xylariomycetidae sp. FL0641]|nr:hypothetical protein F4780DRAFT_796459 [Xylariomycetidae sp. FL0641]
MSGRHPERSSANNPPFRTADEIIRSILDDSASPAEVSPSGELYRAIERFHASRRPAGSAQRDLVRNHLTRWASRSSSRNSMSSDHNSETHRRFSREPLPPSAPSLPPLRSLGSRRPSLMSGASNPPGGRLYRARLSDTSSSRLRSQQPANRSEMDDDTLDLWDNPWNTDSDRRLDARQSPAGSGSQSLSPSDDAAADRHRDETHSSLRALLEFTTHTPARPHPHLSFSSPAFPAHEHSEENRRVKRRKLDSDCLSTGLQAFRYGKYGQVEPGQLIMELVSCDGGIYSDDGQKYAAENILKNDQTVYCTEGPRCNIVLRHQGGTPFTLKELIIKAPRSNFTSPVQEGMVFVSMTSDYLLTRTAQYQIQYSPSRSSSRRTGRDTQPLAPILSIRHNEDGTTMTRAQARARRLYDIGMENEDSDIRVAQIPSEFNVSPPPFQVTTECSDDEGDDPHPRFGWRPPNRIGSLPFESDDDDDDGPGDFSFGGPDYRSRRRRSRASTALAEAAEAAQLATQEAVRAVGGELLVPHARFFIERNKSKCTIKFDPPVSGRFILLKMWSPQRDPNANIDIQAVVAKGFAGPRFFPSVELR